MLNELINTSQIIDQIRGDVTVELFDARSNKLLRREQKHNFIANLGRQYLQYLQRVSFKSGISGLNSTADTDTSVIECFDSIVLSNSVSPANPTDEWFIPGDMVGWANKSTYSGPDILRGTPNATLSSTSSSKTKWVFDWPVHAANGTIGSVCWANNMDTTSFMASSSLIESRSFPGVYPIAIRRSDGYLFRGSGTTVTVYDSNLATISSFTTISVSGLCWDSGTNKLWVISGNQIASYSDTGTLVDGPISVTARSYRGLTSDGSGLWTTARNDTNVYKISYSGVDISNFSANLGDSNTVTYWGLDVGRDICWDSATNTLLVTGGYYPASSNWQRMRRYTVSGSSTGYLTSLNAWDGSSYVGGYNYNYYYYDTYYATTYFDLLNDNTLLLPRHTYDNNYIFSVRLDDMGTRALLPSPITKTNSQTLRVTYEFNYS